MILLAEEVSGMYIKSIDMSDFRCFNKAKASFCYPDESKGSKARYSNINLVLGTNASGKSAVLKALALSVLAPILPSSGYVPNYIVRRPRKTEKKDPPRASATSELVLYCQYPSGEQIKSTRGQVVVERKGDRDVVVSTAIVNEGLWQGIFSDKSPSFFLVAYGATRRVEIGEIDLLQRDKLRTPRYQRVSGLFEDYVALTPPATWIRHLDSFGFLEEAVSILNQVLPDEVKPRIDRTSGTTQIIFDAVGTELPFAALADGYRAFIGWIGDLLFNLGQSSTEGSKLIDIRGVVIIDEIDLHLHPEWQMIVVDKISNAFPNLQFFLTTHSPLITSSLETKNIWRCEIDDEGVRKLVRATENPFGLSPDQILTSESFGLLTVRPERATESLREIAKKAANGDPNAAVDFLRTLSGKNGKGDLDL